MDADIFLATAPLVAAFERLGVPYHLGGSVVSSAFGVPRSTLDVDLVADLRAEHVQRLVEALSDAYYIDADMIHDAIRRRACFNLIHLATMLKLDVFILRARSYDQTAFSRMVRKELQPGEAYFVSSPEDTILNKLEWYRLGGEVSDRQWHDILGMLRVQGPALDQEYLAKWAAAINVTDLLGRALRAAGCSAAATP